MSVVPKPFNIDESIVRSIFAGRPSVFCAEDLNRQFDVIDYAMKKTSFGVGLMRSNWNVRITSGIIPPSIPDSLNHYNWFVHAYLEKIDSGQNAYVFGKGCEIEIAEEEFSKTFVFNTPFGIGCYLFLIAKRDTITYAENPAMSGINSSEHPTTLPSSDTVVYNNPRIVFTQYGYIDPPGQQDEQLLELGAGEEIIGVIWSLTQATDYSVYNTPISIVRPTYHATMFSDILAEESMLYYDVINDEQVNFYQNKSLLDVVLQLRKVFEQRFQKLESYFLQMSPIPGVIGGTSLNSLIAMDTAFSVKPFSNDITSKLSYRRMFNRIFIDFDLNFAYNYPTTPSPACFYIRIPQSSIVKTGINSCGFLKVWADVNGGGTEIVTWCTVEAISATSYLKITPVSQISIGTNPDVFASDSSLWLGMVSGGDDQSCTVKGSISVEINT